MADQDPAIPGCSKSLYLQRVENATNLNELFRPSRADIRLSSESSSDEEEAVLGVDGSLPNQQVQSDDAQPDLELRSLFNYTANDERSWVFDVLQENLADTALDPEVITENEVGGIVHAHKTVKKEVPTSGELPNEMYYAVGLISSVDKYPEIRKMPVRVFRPSESTSRQYSPPPAVVRQYARAPATTNLAQRPKPNTATPQQHTFAQPRPVTGKRKRTKKFKDEESKKKWEDVMTLKRKKVFTSIVKKEVGKQHRAKINKHKEVLLQCKKVALQCQKVVRQRALQSARLVKEQQWRMKRLARENLAYWKRSKRVDREMRRKLEKEAEEQRKIDFEFVEAKRQQRKLNFLITQTELYAHFMSRKLGKGSTEEQLRILSQLDEEKIPRLANIDDYDCDAMKLKAMKNAEDAFQSERARTKNFDLEAHSMIDVNKEGPPEGEHLQPFLFRGNLKGYQLRGMNWLANLYDQGISGILADEMGLGKTVQSIAFLCHTAERYSVWGPFLIISPASTLHNWQQELAKFVPDFKVVPYWGSPNERKILRQFWDQKDMHTKDASFHIVVTSYQIVISDIKYFNRIKWQYMILDEAQAIKSTNSMRWKTLLGFSCRNRLLLSGTPIQNSMAELWALLHFIMPTLFDSHEEFNEWFSKDIESHAENKTGIDEKHLSRLHMILKPFMLRRIKKDVENELSDKIEIMVYCPLTTRQKLLYMALKQKIRIEDLLHYTVGGGDSHTVDKNFTSNLMNLVMQFRKVCNHPELFERRDAKSPIYMLPYLYQIPGAVCDLNVAQDKNNVIQKYLSFTMEFIHEALLHDFSDTIFNFASTLNLSFADLYNIFLGDMLYRWTIYYEMEKFGETYYKNQVQSSKVLLGYMWSLFKMSSAHINSSETLKELTFTHNTVGNNIIYTHTTHSYYSMPETLEHRKIRNKTKYVKDATDELAVKLHIKDIPHQKRSPQTFKCQRTALPTFLFCAMPKIETVAPNLYCYSRRFAWKWQRFVDDYSWNSVNNYWSVATQNDLPGSPSIHICQPNKSAFDKFTPVNGWSHIVIPDKETLVTDSGKLFVLDGLLKRLKEEGHRVLIYSQMTKMIDLLEEYMWHRHHTYMRLDGSSKISERRDMVADFQARTDIFVFLLSTRAGGLGINLTAADTVIFYDSDWNPTVDQQAMDRAHRLGQTKQVTVYRLICKGSIEERILQRAREKSEIQKLVISGGNFKPDTLKPKEVVSLLLDDEEIEQKYRQRTEERRYMEDMRELEKKRKYLNAVKAHLTSTEAKRIKYDSPESGFEDPWLIDSGRSSPHSDNSVILTGTEDLSDGNLLDVEGDLAANNKYTVYNLYGSAVKQRPPGRGASKRGRPRGSRRFSALGRFNSNTAPANSTFCIPPSEMGIDPHLLQPNSNFEPTLLNSGGSFGSTSSGYTSSPSRRGPGRPRIKPNGPPHTGTRGPYRPRRPARPLPVPLHSDVGGSSISMNSGVYSHLYDYFEQQPSDS